MYEKVNLLQSESMKTLNSLHTLCASNLNVVKALLALHNLKGPHGMYIYHAMTQINDFC